MKECRASVIIDSKNKEELYSLVCAEYPFEDCSLTGLGVRVYGEINLNQLLKKIIDSGIVIENVVCNKSSIEDYYLSLIGGVKHD